ncbi:PTS IIA-like nitrogen-regulatory protein PtsN [Sphingomonas antarctica]|uniref:PTS sugar transporter subunit IIA n=1 Tax=Sphingomonas antarctica TaxID=2040274 RepID=UPI0039E92702
MFDITRPGAVAPAMHVAGKKPLFHELAAMAAKAHALDAGEILELLTERERLGPTGFGGGTAIPHARIPGLDHVVGSFARLTHPVDYAAVDGVPVDLVYLLLSPVDAGAAHLKALAHVSRLLRDKSCVAKLRDAGSSDAIVALLDPEDWRDAA